MQIMENFFMLLMLNSKLEFYNSTFWLKCLRFGYLNFVLRIYLEFIISNFEFVPIHSPIRHPAPIYRGK